MRFVKTDIENLLIVKPDVFSDERGFFLETYQSDKYARGGIDAVFVQDNHSKSVRGTLRGLHGQRRFPQGKLVRCVAGEVFDVAVDLRSGSATFGQHAGVVLSSHNFHQLFIPPGFAHGFCVLSETAEIEYKCTDFYRPDDEYALLWNDPDLAISWPVSEPILSEKDRNAMAFSEFLASGI